MAAKCSIATSVIWNWVIKALASSEEVDTSTLIGLAKLYTEISGDLGEDAREMVSLRILESLFFHSNEATVNCDSDQKAKISFDVSEHCANVLRQILCKTPDGMANLEKEKWDVGSFLAHKRSSLPKCMLKKLKEAILEDRHPLLASLKERSTLEIANTVENRDVQNTVAEDNIAFPNPRENENKYQEKVLQAADQVGSSTDVTTKHPGKEEFDVNAELLVERSYGNNTMEHDDRLITVSNSHRQECDMNTESLLEGSCRNNMMEHDDQPVAVSNSHKEECGMNPECRLEGSYGNNTTEHDDQLLTVSNNHREECENNTECLLDGSCPNNMMEHDDQLLTVSNGHRKECEKNTECHLKGSCRNSMIEHDDQPVTVSSSHREECRMNTECLLEASCRNNMIKDGDQPVTVSNSHRVDAKKTPIASNDKIGLNSHRTPNQDSRAGIEWSEIDLCLKCDEGGLLLVCSSDACPIRVHESCLGSDVTLDENGKFFCPFCAYSHAISEYREAERKASLARNVLQAFTLCNVKQNKSTKKQRELDKKEDEQVGAFDVTTKRNDNCGEKGEVLPVTSEENVGEGCRTPTGKASLQEVSDPGHENLLFNGNENETITGENADVHIQNGGLNQETIPLTQNPKSRSSMYKQNSKIKESHRPVEFTCSRNLCKRKAQ